MNKSQKSHCCYCSMQCGIEVVRDENGRHAVKPRTDFPVATASFAKKDLIPLNIRCTNHESCIP